MKIKLIFTLLLFQQVLLSQTQPIVYDMFTFWDYQKPEIVKEQENTPKLKEQKKQNLNLAFRLNQISQINKILIKGGSVQNSANVFDEGIEIELHNGAYTYEFKEVQKQINDNGIGFFKTIDKDDLKNLKWITIIVTMNNGNQTQPFYFQIN